MDARAQEVHTAIPARVEAYDPATQKVDAKPLVQRRVLGANGAEAVEPIPIVASVPVAFPRGGGFFLSFPLQVGDLVLLVFTERSLDKWLDGRGEEVDPVDLRTHDLSDAVAIPGVYPFRSAVADAGSTDAVLGKDGSDAQVHLRADDTIHVGKNATAAAARVADPTSAAASMATWITNVSTALTTLGQPVSPPTDFGTISAGSAKVKVL